MVDFLFKLLPDYLFEPLFPFALGIGHLALWVMIVNRLHATGWPRPLIKAIDKVIYSIVLGLPIAVVARLSMSHESSLEELFEPAWLNRLWLGYSAVCGLAALVVALTWFQRRTSRHRTRGLVSNDTTVHDAVNYLGHRPVHGWPTRVAAALPLNQIFKLHVNVKTLLVPNLPPALDGLSIAHLSDIHMTGRITRPFFDFVVDRTNELDADLICITGDIVEKVPCLAWIEPTLSRLKARHGMFFVLGNHDKRIRDVGSVRRALENAGLVDLGGRWLSHGVRNEKLFLAGNERPWFGALPDLNDAPLWRDDKPLCLLLSHTPDQITWARQHPFDLMLAGHNHGGQICLPFIGPLVSPSYFGVKYASGLFQEGPMLLHVSRGVSGLEPLRFNCPPEITKLVLVREVLAGEHS